MFNDLNHLSSDLVTEWYIQHWNTQIYKVYIHRTKGRHRSKYSNCRGIQYHSFNKGQIIQIENQYRNARFEKIKNCLQENFKGIFDKELEWYEKRFNSLNKEIYGE